MRVTTEVAKDFLGTAKRTLCVHHPILGVQLLLEKRPLIRTLKRSGSTSESQLTRFLRTIKRGEELAAEDTTQHFDWQQVSFPRRNPTSAVG